METNNDFKVESVLLEGNNLIEASAGTGKTYSIAILVLRLIIETDTPIEKVLLVTFTEAAAAELKERTQAFLYLALKECKSPGTSGNDTIKNIVQKALKNKINVESKLKAALLDLDKATISTIHGFCQQTLTEFAFETNQMYGKEVLKDTALLIEEEVNRYWREVVVKMEYDFLKEIGLEERETWVSAVKNVMSGQKLPEDIYEIKNKKEFDIYIEKETKSVHEYFEKELPRLAQYNLDHNNGKKQNDYFINKDALIAYLSKKDTEIKNGYLEHYKKEIRLAQSLSFIDFKRDVAVFHIKKSCEIISERIETKLEEKSLFTFNELIQKVYDAINNESFKELLRAKYSAVFVDEFQDTDKKQYAIFEEIFQKNEDSILFFIGDPKQSIYGWRQADIATYKKARGSENMKVWKMNVNYRSSKEFVAAGNDFFDGVYPGYPIIESNNKNSDGKHCVLDNKPFEPICIVKNIKNGDGVKASIDKTFNLLFSKEFKLNSKHVMPSNVAVLVRKAKEAREVKEILDRLGIPSVIINDENVFQTVEAESIKEILTAILNISKSNIDRAMITPILGRKIHDLEKYNYEDLFQFFLELKKIWEEKGIFKTLQSVLNYFEVQKRFEGNKDIKGQQLISNTLQLIDLLQSVTLENSFTPTECLQFLKDEIKNTTQNDAYVQRIESDEDAVTIMTIHKSKGLEFDVVVLPYLNLNTTIHQKIKFKSFRKDDEYIFSKRPLSSDDEQLYVKETIAENERLLYVAITRAKYSAIIHHVNSNDQWYKNNSLTPYIDNLSKISSEKIEVIDFDIVNSQDLGWNYVKRENINQETQETPKLDPALPELNLTDKNYHKMSYSFLAQKLGNHTIKVKEREYSPEEDYDQFIFETLPKGAHIGNLLHDIFEWSDFTNPDEWEKRVEQSLGRFYPKALANEETKELYLEKLTQLMHHVLNGKIVVNGESIKLSTIARNKMIAELEFNFPVEQEMEQYRFNYVLEKTDSRAVNVVGKGVKGLMNGLIDLFFEYNGKYYILDWKSNYLGDQLEHYSPEPLVGEDIDRLTLAMNESNYHLQYLLYTVAVDKYLNSRLPDYDFEKHFGGIIYVFLRGTRSGKSSGLYVRGVKKEELEKLKGIV